MRTPLPLTLFALCIMCVCVVPRQYEDPIRELWAAKLCLSYIIADRRLVPSQDVLVALQNSAFVRKLGECFFPPH